MKQFLTSYTYSRVHLLLPALELGEWSVYSLGCLDLIQRVLITKLRVRIVHRVTVILPGNLGHMLWGGACRKMNLALYAHKFMKTAFIESISYMYIYFLCVNLGRLIRLLPLCSTAKYYRTYNKIIIHACTCTCI